MVRHRMNHSSRVPVSLDEDNDSQHMHHNQEDVNKNHRVGHQHQQQPVGFGIVLGLSMGVLLIWIYHIHMTDSFQGGADESNNPTQQAAAACQRMKNFQDVQICYADQIVRKISCTTISTWTDVQSCLMGRYNINTNNRRLYNNGKKNRNRNNPPPITQIRVLGERNSGTKFVVHELQQCFPRTDENFRVARNFLRNKHFFQPIDIHYDATPTRFIIVVVRNPIDWIAAMLENPYHSPNHVQGFANGKPIPLSWQEFVNRPWKTEPTKYDLEILWKNTSLITSPGAQRICRQGFSMKQVVPCTYDHNYTKDVLTGQYHIPKNNWRGYEPIYELEDNLRKTTGQHYYNHILELRRDKIINFILQIPLLLHIGGFWVIRYEDLLRHGTRPFLEQIGNVLGKDLSPDCKPTPPQPERLVGRRHIPDEFRTWIENHLDVETERLLGYR